MHIIPTLQNLFNDEMYSNINYDLLKYLGGLLESVKPVNDNFLGKMNGDYYGFLDNRNDFVRFNAFNLFCTTSTNTKLLSKTVKKFLKDRVFYIQCRAAMWAGELGFTEFAKEINGLRKIATGQEYDELCNALIKLNIPIE